jgi:RHS repeat-associated protein
LYSPVALVYTGGVVLERYEYDAYGDCHVLEPNYADDPDGKSDYENPYLFTGRRVDILDEGSLKIQYNRNRYYDYYTGRWTTHDPLGYLDGMNSYLYGKSNPVQFLDPDGRLVTSPIIAGPTIDWSWWIMKKIRGRCYDKCIAGSRDFRIVDEIMVPAGGSPTERKAISLVHTASKWVNRALRNPWTKANHAILDAYIKGIIFATGSVVGVDLYLKIEEKECKKRRCGFLWCHKGYDWKKSDTYYYRCTAGLFVPDPVLDRYLSWEDAIRSIPDCRKQFKEDFDYNIDPAMSFLFMAGCPQP